MTADSGGFESRSSHTINPFNHITNMLIYSIIITILFAGLVVVEIIRERKNAEDIEALKEDIRKVEHKHAWQRFRMCDGLADGYYLRFEAKGYEVRMRKTVGTDAAHPSPAYILIKSFPYGDDPDFALLQAEELLDKLNEK